MLLVHIRVLLIGTGKTMLLRNLFKELDQDTVIAVELLSTQLRSDDLIVAVAEAFANISTAFFL